MAINSFEDLEVYQLSIKLVKSIYQLNTTLPAIEKYCIADQLRRCSTSIGANIAEGFGRNSTKEFLKFLYNARGSLMETRHFIILIKELNYTSQSEIKDIQLQCDRLGIKINNLIKALNNKSPNHN